MIELLYKAACTGSPWKYGKDLLVAAGSEQIKMHDFFSRTDGWKELIESDGLGMYRLNL